jgi:acetylornithine deacetylase/succinyl-diaminopimelate desuccinylase-like protein
MRDLLDRPDLARARRVIYEDDPRTLREQRELSEIPAPPFGEGPRSERMAELMSAAGLDRTARDALGNVVGWWGAASGAPFVLSAHLDTIFPAGTDVRVREEGDRLVGPGISDDARGLAALLALARALARSRPELARPVLFAATVGEEGEGDLRGVRHLFRKGGPAEHAAAFISLDGAGLSRIVNGGLGSRRFRLTVRGPGGHSWVDWGTPNPIHALGRAVAAFTELALAQEPRTTLSVGRWAGGTSVNAIPQEAWVELEVRSQSVQELDRLDARIRRGADDALAAVNQSPNGRGRAELEVQVIGDRPAGTTDPELPLVRAAVSATHAVGAAPELAVSSTDANIPMALGIPAVTMGAGGEAGLAHTPEEWYRNECGPDGILRALLTLMRAAQE